MRPVHAAALVLALTDNLAARSCGLFASAGMRF